MYAMLLNSKFIRNFFMISLFLLVGTSWAQTGRGTSIQGEFWTTLNPLVNGIPQQSPSRDVLTLIILSEARSFFSGMIFGYSFTYTPYDAARKISEHFVLLPRGFVQASNTQLDFIDSRIQEGRFMVRLAYRPNSTENATWQRWKSAALPDSVGMGISNMANNPDARYESFRLACKEAVRAYGRSISKNKPNEMRGSFALAALPVFSIQSGEYVCRVRIRMQLEEIDAYRTW
jgi:hypothetical protein